MLNREFIQPLLFAGAPIDGALLVAPRRSDRLAVIAPALDESGDDAPSALDRADDAPSALDRADGGRIAGEEAFDMLDVDERGATRRPAGTPDAAPDLLVLEGEVVAEEPLASDDEAADETAADPAAVGSGAVPDLGGYEAYERAASAAPALSRDELVQRYAHLVKYVVGRLGVSVPGLFDHEDAMQAGVLGLLRAIDAYRPESAASFESYAILRIRGSILDAVRALDSVGRAGREAARAIQGAIRELQHELGRAPTEGEIAGRLGLSLPRYRERLQSASIVTVSLDERDAREGDDENAVLADNAPDPNAIDPAEEAARKDAIASLAHEINRLGTRAKTVLGLYYQDEMTFKEIGAVLGVTESRVCQIHTEAILTLRGRLLDPDVAARIGRRRARA